MHSDSADHRHANDEHRECFRLLQGGKNIGKLVLETDETTQVKTIHREEQSMSFPGDATMS
jgi:hypothetical protein